ncbi:MAG: class I SAM-dependent methyltransferase [Planctomycetes bacterium]|nr:class I SAM-dependent methyltransferase [Planctomycetota bacterium]
MPDEGVARPAAASSPDGPARADSLLDRYTARAHDRVVEIFRALRPGRVLDVPTATGVLAKKLALLGHQPTCGDISAAGFAFPELPHRLLDLNRELPFEPAAFDHVCCAEGIEHLENPHHLLREFARILAPGGHLVLTTPNVLSLRSRWMYLWESRPAKFNDFTEDSSGGYLKPQGHINPVAFPELKHLLNRTGFELLDVGAGSLGGGVRGLSWLLAPLVRLRSRGHVYAEYLVRDELLYGENLVLHARRRA